MKINKKALVLNSLTLLAGLLVACGAKKVDVTETLTLSYSGANGYGVAELENEYGWEAAAFEEAGIEAIETFSDLGNAFNIESAVSYEVSPKENLSNGDKITVTATINEEKAKSYNLKLIAKERTFTVEGLPEVQQVDLFEDIDVHFDGIAPYATASIVDVGTDDYVYTQYILDKNSDLNIGDIVTVTANYDQEKLLSAGYIAESDTKEFQVSNVSRYAKQISDISEDAIEKLKKQSEDIIKSNVAKISGYSLSELTFLGNYFLNAKGNVWNGNNYIYYVYQIDLTGSKDITYYYYVGYYDISITETGECVYDFKQKDEPYGNGFSLGWNYVIGFENMDNLFNDCVTKNLADYEYESTVLLEEAEQISE